MVINVRGTSGSGKSWVMRQLMARFGSRYDHNLLSHVLNGTTLLLGRYDSQTGEVGLDYLMKQISITRRGRREVALDYIHSMATQRMLPARSVFFPSSREEDGTPFENVLFEGLLATSVYGRYRRMADEVDFRWVFLNTSLEICLAQVKERGKRTRNSRLPLNPDNTIEKWKITRRHVEKARADGMKFWDVSSAEAVELIASWI